MGDALTARCDPDDVRADEPKKQPSTLEALIRASHPVSPVTLPRIDLLPRLSSVRRSKNVLRIVLGVK